MAEKYGLRLVEITTNKIRTYADELALLEKRKRIEGVSNTVFANNGTSEPSENGSYYPLTVTGSTEIEEGKETTYEVTEFKLYPDKTDDKEALEKDKTEVRWVFYIDGIEIKNNTLKYIDLKRFPIKDREDSPTDFMSITDLKERSKAILNYAILSFHFVRESKSKETTKVTFKFSKWLDGHKIYIEAYRRKPDIKNATGGATVATTIKAQPEIIKGFWVNDKREEITNKIVGYKDTVYMCLQTLGMKDKVVTTELWEEGITFMGSTSSNDETICMNENIEWKLTDRQSYKKLELPEQDTEEYKKQRESIWETDPLELYFKIPSEKETTRYKPKFGRLLYLSTKERISDAYFAKEVKQEAIQDGTVNEKEEEIPKTHLVKSGDNIYELTKRYSIKDWMKFAKDNKVKPPNYWLTIGETLTLPEEAVMPKRDDFTEKEATPKAQQQTVYERIDTANLGSEVWLVVETANLHGKKVNIEVFDNEELLEDSDDKPITVLKNDTEVTKLENITINNTGKAKVKIKIRKKSNEDFKKQKKKFEDAKLAKLFLKISYKGEDRKTHKVEFLDGEEFEVKTIKWHEPVDNPISTNYTQSVTTVEDYSKHWGLFGTTRNGSEHAGLDLFTKTGDNIYACVDGTVYNRRWHGGYGNTVTIKVDDPKDLFDLKRDYKLQYPKKGEIEKGVGFKEDGDIYLFYAHLDSVKELSFGDKVKMGDELGTTGRSGVKKGTRAPHLHFEILSEYTMAKTKYRINPAYFVNYKGYDQQTEDEKKMQTEENKRGKIEELEGKKKLEYKNMLNFKK